MEDGKFHPHTQSKGVRKSRDQTEKTQGVIIRKERENLAEILRSELKVFNRQFPVKVEYGDAGGKSKGLKFEGTFSFIAGAMSRSEAIDCLIFARRFIDALPTDRKKRGEELQPFVKKNVAENLAELNLFLRDLREEKSKRMREGKSVGIINTDLRLVGGARSSILTLLEQVPEPLHRQIVEDSIRIETEMKT